MTINTNSSFPASKGERLAKVIARAGVCSRREAERKIESGAVQLNGKTVLSPAINVQPKDIIKVEGKQLPEKDKTRLWLFHKPKGCITTAHDPEGRTTVFELLPQDMGRVISVGRLDINTEGLLLLTNDGELSRTLELPQTGWLRKYRVRALGRVKDTDLEKLRNGLIVEGIRYAPIEATIDTIKGDNMWLTVGLREGKNREVKTALSAINLEVNRLIRVSFGPFQLGSLKRGELKEIKTSALKSFLGEKLFRAGKLKL